MFPVTFHFFSFFPSLILPFLSLTAVSSDFPLLFISVWNDFTCLYLNVYLPPWTISSMVAGILSCSLLFHWCLGTMLGKWWYSTDACDLITYLMLTYLNPYLFWISFISLLYFKSLNISGVSSGIPGPLWIDSRICLIVYLLLS